MSKKNNPKIHNFNLGNEDFIELFKLLKLLNLVGSGGEAKGLIDEGFVKMNGVTETRKRAKVRADDTVEIQDNLIRIGK